MDWHAQHGRKRKLGRIVIRATKAYMDAGGRFDDLERLKLIACDFGDLFGDAFGYANETFDGGAVDLTPELLNEALRLTHPDVHPPELQELATRVTRELAALKPFVFSAPKPKPATTDDELAKPDRLKNIAKDRSGGRWQPRANGQMSEMRTFQISTTSA